MARYNLADWAAQTYLVLVGLLVACFHRGTVPYWGLMLALHGAGLLSIWTLVRSAARFPENRGLDWLRHLYPIPLFLAFYRESAALNQMFFTGYLDAMFMRWDQALFGCQPGLQLMRLMPWRLVGELFYAAYFSYYLMIAGVGVGLFLKDRRALAHYVATLSLLLYVCYLIYILMPVSGPRIFWTPGYVPPAGVSVLPDDLATPDAVRHGLFFQIMEWLYVAFEAPGAAFPSSHVAVACLTLYFTRRYYPRARIVHGLVVVLLCAATVYCRYHYVVDVLAGFALTALVLPLANRVYFWFETRLVKQG